MPTLSLLPIVYDDLPFVRTMLYEAAFWRSTSNAPPLNEALRQPELAGYVDGWGRHGDQGLIARIETTPVGAVWIRRFTDDDHGYGYLDEDTPELSIAVETDQRGIGIGRCLGTAMLTQARLNGITRISLSVENDNPARSLYDDLGFMPVAAVGGSVTMARSLR